MTEAEKELKKRKYRKLIDGLSRVTSDMKSLEERAKTCRINIKENVTIDYKIFQEEEFEKIEKEIKNILNNIERNVVPHLKNEMKNIT